MIQPQRICVFNSRLVRATRVELDRLCTHLGLDKGANTLDIEQAYLSAADNSIFQKIRPLLPTDSPTYLKALVLIDKERRSYSEALDEFSRRVKSLDWWSYRSPVEDMDELELEDKILAIFRPEYRDAREKLRTDPSWMKKFVEYLPGVVTAGVGAATTVVIQTASRLPFAALGAGAVAGPIGAALGVITIGRRLTGPAYRKIVPATVELMLIGQRIENTPKE